MDLLAFARLEKQIQTQNININGTSHEQQIVLPFLTCSNCSHILANFEQNTPLPHIIGVIKSNLIGNLNYCPHCGAKLQYNFEIIDANI